MENIHVYEREHSYPFVSKLKTELTSQIKHNPNIEYSINEFQTKVSSVLTEEDIKIGEQKPQSNLRRGTSLLSDRLRTNPLPQAPVRCSSPTELYRQPAPISDQSHRRTRSNSTSSEFHRMQFENKRNTEDLIYSTSSPVNEYLTNQALRPGSMFLESPRLANKGLDLDSSFNLSQSLMTRPTFLKDFETNFQEGEDRQLTLQERNRLRRMTSDLSKRIEVSELSILKDQKDAMERIEELEDIIKQLKLDKTALRKENSRMIQVETTLSSQLIQVNIFCNLSI